MQPNTKHHYGMIEKPEDNEAAMGMSLRNLDKHWQRKQTFAFQENYAGLFFIFHTIYVL